MFCVIVFGLCVTRGPMKKKNYLNNRDLLREIHLSKLSYSEFVDEKYQDFDIIVDDQNLMFDSDIQQQALENRAKRLTYQSYYQAVNDNMPDVKLSDHRRKASEFDLDDLVFRVHTYEHIPLAPNRKKNPKKTADHHVKLNFQPFKHYIIENNQPKQVGISHYRNGKFSDQHGSITPTLANMLILLTNRYSQRANWRGYSYLDEMIGQSLLQLSQMALQFDESKSDNPFAYYTRAIERAFTRVLNLEKSNQRARDELLINRGQLPSYGRQIEHENQLRQAREQREDQNEE